MISEKVAAGVVGIMIGLQDFPANEIRRRKLVKAFRSADTEAIAARAISHWVSDSNRCPNPEEIRSIIMDLNAKHREDVGSARAKCVACSGTGWVEMRGINRFDGLIVTGSKPCVCRSMGQPVVEDKDACPKCGGHGLHGGRIGTDHDGPWETCLCAAGRTEDAQRRVDEGNAARDKILAKGNKLLGRLKTIPEGYGGLGQPGTPLRRIQNVLGGYDEAYNGEF